MGSRTPSRVRGLPTGTFPSRRAPPSPGLSRQAAILQPEAPPPHLSLKPPSSRSPLRLEKVLGRRIRHHRWGMGFKGRQEDRRLNHGTIFFRKIIETGATTGMTGSLKLKHNQPQTVDEHGRGWGKPRNPVEVRDVSTSRQHPPWAARRAQGGASVDAATVRRGRVRISRRRPNAATHPGGPRPTPSLVIY